MNVRFGCSVLPQKSSLIQSSAAATSGGVAEAAPSVPCGRRSLRRDVLRLLAAHLVLLLAFALWQAYALQQLATLSAQRQSLQELRADLPSSEVADVPAGSSPEPAGLIARMEAARSEGSDPERLRPLQEQAVQAIARIDRRIAILLDRMKWAIGLLVTVMLLLQAGALWSLRRQILQPLAALAGRAERIASGLSDDMTPMRSTRREFRLIARALDGVGEREARSAELLQRDETTGLPNRRAARQTLNRWVEEVASGAVIMLRVVNLGSVRAVYGEAEANALFKRYAHEAEAAAGRWCDCIAAYAEDVLMLLVRSGAEAALADVVKAVMAARGNDEAERSTRPELVAAIALFPVHGDTVDAVIGQASAALDDATARGAGAVERARQTGAGSLRRHLVHHEATRRAVEGDRLELWYMPIVDVHRLPGRICHAEALMRMRDADGKTHPVPVEMMERLLVTPDLLLPASERCFRQACETLKRLHADGHNIALAFNLAAPELRDEHLARLMQIFVDSGLPPASLMLEITERVALRGMDKVVPRLQAAREQGVRVVLDDFGTGFSSLSHLVELPIDGIKIDRVFIKDLGSDARSREIVSATSALAQVLKLEVVGEGVETETQRDLLRELGCCLHQGYLYAKAMPADQLRLRRTAGL